MKTELSELEEVEAEAQFRTDVLERLREIVRLLGMLAGGKAEEADSCGEGALTTT